MDLIRILVYEQAGIYKEAERKESKQGKQSVKNRTIKVGQKMTANED